MSATILNTSVGNLSEELEVNASIDYDGDVPDGETVVPTTFLVDGSVANETNVTVEDGSPTDVTFATELDEDTVPVTSVTVETPGRSDTVEFARAVTTDVSVNDPFASNESLEAVVEIENDGDTPEMVNLTVSVDDPASVESDGSESRELSVNASETVEAEFTFEPTDHASSQIEVTAEAGDSSDTATTNRPVFEVEDVELEGADDAGSGLTMSGNVTNTGEIPDTQTIQFTLDGELVTEKNVTLDPDESETVSADIEPPEEDGEYGFGMTANNETATAGESAEGSAEINVSGTSLLDRLSSLALPLLLLGLLVIGVVALKYRDDPQAFKRRIATAQSTVQSAVQGIVGGGGSVIVENGLPRDSTVRIQVKDANGVVFQEDLQLADGEQREFPSLPDDGQFEVGVGVDDVASHSEVFQGPTDSVGVVLQPDGITIAEL
ncbi:COG1470 family protein [Halostagnicola bangensis]